MNIYAIDSISSKGVYSKEFDDFEIRKFLYKGEKANPEDFKDYTIEYKNKSKKNAAVVSLWGSPFFAVSEKFKNVIEAIDGAKIDFVPVKNEFDKTVYILNPLEVLDIFDYEKIDEKEDDAWHMDGLTDVAFKKTDNLPPVFLCRFYNSIVKGIYVTDDFINAVKDIDGFSFRIKHKDYAKPDEIVSDKPVFKMESERYSKLVRLLELVTDKNPEALRLAEVASKDMFKFLLTHEKECDNLGLTDLDRYLSEKYFKYLCAEIFCVILVAAGFSSNYTLGSPEFFVRSFNELAAKFNVSLDEKPENYEPFAYKAWLSPMIKAVERKGLACIIVGGFCRYFPIVFPLENACEAAHLMGELNYLDKDFFREYGYLENSTFLARNEKIKQIEEILAPEERKINKARAIKYYSFVRDFTNNDEKAVSLINEGSENIIAFYQNHKDEKPFSMVLEDSSVEGGSHKWNFTMFRKAEFDKVLPLDNAFLYQVLEYCGYVCTYYWDKNETFVAASKKLAARYGETIPDSLTDEEGVTEYLSSKDYALCKINKCGHYWEPFNPEHYPFKLIVCKKDEAMKIALLLASIGEKEIEWVGADVQVKKASPYKDKLSEFAKGIVEDFLKKLKREFPKSGDKKIARAFIDWYYAVDGGQIDISLVTVDTKQFEDAGESECSCDYNFGTKVKNRFASKFEKKVCALADKVNKDEYNGGTELITELMEYVDEELHKLDFSSVNTSEGFKFAKPEQYD